MPKSPRERTSDAPERSRRRVKLKPHDSFDLIRLLARSQSDARKAVGEFVQNSLDANARRVDITWFNDKRVRCLSIRDEGEGIFPTEERPAALQTLAQTIGHSHKRSLTPMERREQMTLGKYGIGLLGFWCVARFMEIHSRVAGSETWALLLEEDQPEAQVFRPRPSKLEDQTPTFTEITLRGVKESVARQIRPARLQAYLAAELRGQLLQRDVEVRIHDRIARGFANKEFVVKPRAFLGIAIDELKSMDVPGHEDARLELYFVPSDEGRLGVVSLACGGSTVLDDLALVDLTDPTGGTRAPWNSGLFEGVIDFPELDVAPGTRRGFVPNEAALDFLIALEKLEHRLAERIAQDDALRVAQRRVNLARELRRAFASVARRLPHYDMFDVRPTGDAPLEPVRAAGSAANGEAFARDELDAVHAGEASDKARERDAPNPEEPALFPPGPMSSVRLSPARARVAPGNERRFRAVPLDADGRRSEGDFEFAWSLEGLGTLTPNGADATFMAANQDGAVIIQVTATDDGRSAMATASVEVREDSESVRSIGIPEPQAVNAPSEAWRSRIRGERWEYNEGHRDYRAVRNDDARRFRYLCHLFAKEVVLKNFGDPVHEEILERMVEILAHLADVRGRGA